ncbi:MAG: hypothetical protein IPF73_19910 [Betaproteobacteria bacterium]|nr:hypothetical protein [Betaproteobacteria bacterium]
MSFPLAGAWSGDFCVGNASMSRTVFDAVGRFDETFRHDLFDDWEFGRRMVAAGVTAHFVPRAIAWHDHEVTLEERALAMRRLGACVAARERARPVGVAGCESRSGTLEGDLREARSAGASGRSRPGGTCGSSGSSRFARGCQARHGSASRPSG